MVRLLSDNGSVSGNALNDLRARPESGRARRLVTAGLRAPVSRRAWHDVLYCLTCLLLGLAGFVPVVVLLVAGTALTCTVVGAVVGMLMLLTGLAVARRFAAANRRLAVGLLGLRMPPTPARRQGSGLLGRLEAKLRDGYSWRAAAYVVIKFPLSYLGLWVVLWSWVYGLFLATYPFWWQIGEQQLHSADRKHSQTPLLTPYPAGGLRVDSLGGAFSQMLLGVGLLLVAPWVTRAVVLADQWLLQHLLTPGGLAARVRELEKARALAIDDAAARLRRVERDLHDGAQARLVALALTLGMAREKLGEDVDPQEAAKARALVDSAHLSAKQALTELRDLARGIHPPVLDNGLPDALLSLGAQSPVDVGVFAEIPDRPTAAIEAIAYFCAAELIANVAKHSGASNASLEASQQDDVLRLRVWDDGHGGASEIRGGGLAGLTERIRTVDGDIEISSPAGGPTAITVKLPLHA
jgi:signal transduction histidine kinase